MRRVRGQDRVVRARRWERLQRLERLERRSRVRRRGKLAGLGGERERDSEFG